LSGVAIASGFRTRDPIAAATSPATGKQRRTRASTFHRNDPAAVTRGRHPPALRQPWPGADGQASGPGPGGDAASVTGGVCSHRGRNSCRISRAAVLATTRSESTLHEVGGPRQFNTSRPAQCRRNGKRGNPYLIKNPGPVAPYSSGGGARPRIHSILSTGVLQRICVPGFSVFPKGSTAAFGGLERLQSD
jgi:hypothetical protein